MNADFNTTIQAVLQELEKAIIGKNEVLEDVLCAYLAGGHVLLEDYPGVAKTLMSKSFSRVLGLGFKRIQFTPDLLPGDISGGSIFNRQTSEFEFKPGPIFTQVLLADEINRASPKTQAALLEAMAEKQVTLEGETRPMANPFWVLATQNPIEFESTFPLPEAQMDRFLVRLSIGYPSKALETELLSQRIHRKSDEAELAVILNESQAADLQNVVENVEVDLSLQKYIVDLVQATRERRQIAVGASPRGSLGLLAMSRARAALNGRSYVIPDDIKAVAKKVLAHRIVLVPELWMSPNEAEKQIDSILESVSLPVLPETSTVV